MKTNNKFNIGDKVWFVDSRTQLCQGIIDAIEFDYQCLLMKPPKPPKQQLKVICYHIRNIGSYAQEELHETPEQAIEYYKNL